MNLRRNASRGLLVVGQVILVLLFFEAGFRIVYEDPFNNLADNPGGGVDLNVYELERLNSSEASELVVFMGASSMGGGLPGGGGYPIQEKELTPAILEDEFGIPTVNLAKPVQISIDLVHGAEAIAPMHPKAVVLYFGHNDEAEIVWAFGQHPASSRSVRFRPARIIEIEDKPFQRRVSLFHQLEATAVQHSYLVFWLHRRIFADRRLGWYPHMSNEEFQRLYTISTEMTKSNLKNIISIFKEEDVPVIFMTVISDIPYSCGHTFYCDEIKGCGDAIFFEENTAWFSPCDILNEGHELLTKGQRARALHLLKLGASYVKDAEHHQAATPFVNNMIRELAEEHDVILVDTEKYFDELFVKGEVEYGCDMFGNPEYDFCDQVHPNAQTHRAMAELLAPVLTTLINESKEASST